MREPHQAHRRTELQISPDILISRTTDRSLLMSLYIITYVNYLKSFLSSILLSLTRLKPQDSN